MGKQALSIFIADDNEMNRWLLAEQLECWSSNITVASDGREAWRYLRDKHYALVFLDVNMPGFTGHELVKKVRVDSVNSSSRIIAITAHLQSQQRHVLMADGFDECLIKPIMLADLQKIVAEWSTLDGSIHSEYYLQVLMDRVGNNSALGQAFFEKLMMELPRQIKALQQALQNDALQNAWHVAHKLHGSFGFYGFADFREIAESLENALLAGDSTTASHHFQQLLDKFYGLQKIQAEMMRHFDSLQ
jgi:CheY-like chemotaxis protein